MQIPQDRAVRCGARRRDSGCGYVADSVRRRRSVFIIIIVAIIAGAWVKQRGQERQIDAFRNEMNSFRNEMKAELRAGTEKVIVGVGTLRA